MIIGFSLSIPLRFCYDHVSGRYHSMLISGVAMVVLAFLCGILAGLILNPITFYGFRDGLGEEPFFALFAGVLNFTFVFMIWSLGYHVFKNHLNASRSEEEKIPYLDRVPVDTSKLILLVKTEDITHIKSDGEYIRLYTEEDSHLLRKPLSSIQQQLDPMDFQRIHRSTIVNKNFIGSLQPHSNGEYYLILTNGASLKLSRSYKHVLKSLIGTL